MIGRSAVARFKDPAAQLQDMVPTSASARWSPAACATPAPRSASACSCSRHRVVRRCGASSTIARSSTSSTCRATLRPRDAGTAGVARARGTPAHPTRSHREPRRIRAVSAGAAAVPRYSRAESAGYRSLAEGDRAGSPVCVGLAVLAHRFVFKGGVRPAEYLRGIEAGRHAVRIDPQLARAHYALGIALFRAGQLDEGRLRCSAPSSSTRTIPVGHAEPVDTRDERGPPRSVGLLAMRAWPLAPNVPRRTTTCLPLTSSTMTSAGAGWRRAGALQTGRSGGRPAHPGLRPSLALRRVLRGGDGPRREPIGPGPAELKGRCTYRVRDLCGHSRCRSDRRRRAQGRAARPRLLEGIYAAHPAGLPLFAGRSTDRARPLIETALDPNRRAIAEGPL